MRYSVLLIIVLSIYNYGCAQQSLIIKKCTDTIVVENVKDIEEEGNILFTDTLSKKVKLVFEQGFDDLIYICLNEKIKAKKKITTNTLLGVSPDAVELDYSFYPSLPKLSVMLFNKRECISFYPIAGKGIAYVNYIDGAWSVEMSNILREYK